MNYINLEKNISKVWLLLVFSISIILAITSFISYTYLTGFLLGAMISVSFFYGNNFFFGKLLSTKRTFRTTIIISSLKFLFVSCLWIGVLISVIFINKAFNQTNDSSSNIDGIFNFFAVFGGLISFQLSIIIYHIWVSITEKIKKNKKG